MSSNNSDFNWEAFNTMRPEQNNWYFADNIFKCNFFIENDCILIMISPTFVPKSPIYIKHEIGSDDGLAPNR